LNKSIFKLTTEDYEKNGLYQLLDEYHLDVDRLNHSIYDTLIKPITDKPANIYNSRIIIFSPHPDDDVICMGGTM